MLHLDDQNTVRLAMLRQRELGIDTSALTAAINRHAPTSDRTGDIPQAFWDETDVEALNMMLVPERFKPQRAAPPSAISRVATFESVGHADPGYAIALPGPGLSLPPLMALGSEPQQARSLARFRSGRPVWGAFAISEPGVGSDATAIRTLARKTDDGWVLNGTKCFITNGARSDYVIVFATIDPTRGRFGIRAFIVENTTPGFSVDRTEIMLGLRASQLSVLSFTDCEISAENLLSGNHVGRHLDAFSAAQGAWDFMRPMLTSVIVGTCQRIRDELSRHLSGSESSGTARLTRNGLADLLRDMDREIHTARLLAWKAAWMSDNGLPMSKEASMAKAYASTIAIRLAERTLEIVGARALEPGSALERAYRNAKAFDILEGTGDMQRLMVTALHRRNSTDFSQTINP